MSFVFVLDTNKRPLDPIQPGRARLLLTQQKAAVFRQFPFTIILKEAQPVAPPASLRVKIDPGSKTTGLALVNDMTGEVLWAAELTHRGQQVKDALDARRATRRGRRQRHTRYRPPRFNNRTRPKGWLPPSLVSRIQNVVTWVQRLQRLAPIRAISFELVRFDLHLMEHPDISSIDYQHGTLAGREAREYLLLKWNYRCAYCHQEATRWEVDHIIPRSRLGTSNRIKNLALACHACNHEKGDRTAAEYGHPEVQVQACKPLKDAAAVNSTRWALYERLKQMDLPVETGTGGRTQWNRTQRELPKAHWIDAACVGVSTPSTLSTRGVMPLRIKASGRHSRQMCKMDRYGFPVGKAKGPSIVFGWHTGDMVHAIVPTTSKKVGTYIGRVAIKSDGYFKITGTFGIVEGIHARYCHPLHRNDGYGYEYRKEAALPPHA